MFACSRCSWERDSTDHIVVVFLLRVEVHSLHVGVGVTSCFSLDAIAHEAEAMVLDSILRRATLDCHLLVARDGHHALVSSLRVKATSKSDVTVSDSDTAIGLVDRAETFVSQVAIDRTAIRVQTQSTLTSRCELSSISSNRARNRVSETRSVQRCFVGLSRGLRAIVAIDLIFDRAIVPDSSIKRLSIVSH